MQPPLMQQPAKKSRAGLVIGMVLLLMLVVCGGGGVAVWYFAIYEETDIEVFPEDYTRVKDTAPVTTYVFNESIDLCQEAYLDPVTGIMDFIDTPRSESDTYSDGGIYSCSGQLRSDENYREYSPTGSIVITVAVVGDPADAREFVDRADERERGTAIDVADVGEHAVAFESVKNNVHEISIRASSGNMNIWCQLGFNSGTHFRAPDHRMMVELVADVVNGTFIELQPGR